MDEESGDLARKIQQQLVLDSNSQQFQPSVDICSTKLDSLHLSPNPLKRSLSAPNLSSNVPSSSIESDPVNSILSTKFQQKCELSNFGNDNPYLYNIDLPHRRWYSDEPMEEELIFLVTNFHVEDSENPNMPYIS